MTVRLHKVRAGWYETAAEPAVGVYVAYRAEAGHWEVARYVAAPDGGLELALEFFGADTLSLVRDYITYLLEEAA